jgi:hypothetical protein
MKTEVRFALGLAGGILLLAAGTTVARGQGLIGEDEALRLIVGLNGLLVAFYGNRIPKTVAPSAHARQVARMAGWSFVLSGLLYAALWAFAPIPVAIWVGSGAVAGGMVVTVAYCLRLRRRARTQVRTGT